MTIQTNSHKAKLLCAWLRDWGNPSAPPYGLWASKSTEDYPSIENYMSRGVVTFMERPSSPSHSLLLPTNNYPKLNT